MSSDAEQTANGKGSPSESFPQGQLGEKGKKK